MNAKDHAGQTALHWSAVRGAIQVAELLLQEGARVNAEDMYGYQVSFSFCGFPSDRSICLCVLFSYCEGNRWICICEF